MRNLQIDHSEYPPHHLVGTREAMGFDIGLFFVDPGDIRGVCEGYEYEIELLTGVSTEEVLNDQVYDLSL